MKERNLVAGGGAAKMEEPLHLCKQLMDITGMDSHCFCVYANALKAIPYTLAKKAGLKPIKIDCDGIEEGARQGKCQGRH